MGLPSLSSLLCAVQWLLDEWEERGRMEDSEAPSDNTVSSVTLTTTVRASNVLIMNLARKLAEACSLFLALVLCCSGILPRSLTVDLRERKYNMQISTALCLKPWVMFPGKAIRQSRGNSQPCKRNVQRLWTTHLPKAKPSKTILDILCFEIMEDSTTRKRCNTLIQTKS